MKGSRLHNELVALLGPRCEADVPMAPLTTWRVGGPADLLVRPETAAELAAIVRLCNEETTPVRVVGAGSNLLILDGGLRGVTILLRQGFRRFEFAFGAGDEGKLSLGAALSMEEAVDRAAAAGIAGLEFLAGVPGSIGGGVRMNAGTQYGDFSQVLVEIEVVDADGRIRRLPREKLDYRYRGLVIDGLYVVTEAVVAVRRGDAADITAQVKGIVEQRHCKHPWDMPSCGSTFKNPEGQSAGRLIERAGLKGFRVGGAEISEKHANFIVNLGDATARDILAVIEHIRRTVFEKFGVWLEPEVQIWGEHDGTL